MLLLSPELLVADGWISAAYSQAILSDFEGVWETNLSEVDFNSVTEYKRRLLIASFEESIKAIQQSTEYLDFCGRQSWWLENFARFEALREHLGEHDWTQWPLECRAPANITPQLLDKIKNEIEFSKFKQFLFESQWKRLKSYANQKGVCICGDMPIFVGFESADVWANQDQFLLNSDGKPTSVAGVPPDYFSETGQLWGNPLYDWQKMEADNYSWWKDRFHRALDQYDLLRVDHFRGFDQYWKIPAGAETAAEGSWEVGPRDQPFLAAEAALGKLPLWAEDLGDIDQGVHDLRDRLGFPTMRVLQFGYATAHDDFHRHTTIPEHCIAYTGTHDNDTLMGWIHSRGETEAANGDDALAEFLVDGPAIHLQMINLLYASPAKVAIVPLQDAIGLGGEARMNVPGLAEGNWSWRFARHLITPELSAQLKSMVQEAGRMNSLSASLA
ncbi:UNVERIFIED_CONTAM: hypothetical protein GTU68_032794 [Idotea baltica]|nr:hypothetical protein [Idotea baltica]